MAKMPKCLCIWSVAISSLRLCNPHSIATRINFDGAFDRQLKCGRVAICNCFRGGPHIWTLMSSLNGSSSSIIGREEFKLWQVLSQEENI